MIVEPILIRNLIGKDRSLAIKEYVQKNIDAGQYGTDDQVPTAVATGYKDPIFQQLQIELLPFFEKVAGKRLLPTYTYFRQYDKGDVLKTHRDRPACQISVTLQIWSEDDEPWPIYTSQMGIPEWRDALRTGEALEWNMQDGEGVMYPGMEVTHFRLPHTGGKQIQVFLHYVDADGPYAWAENDNREPTHGQTRQRQNVRQKSEEPTYRPY